MRCDDSNVKLASPAVAFNIDWLRVSEAAPRCRFPAHHQEFLKLIPADTRPDFLTVHLYTTSFDDFVRRIEAIYREFQLPIVLNEFAMHVSRDVILCLVLMSELRPLCSACGRPATSSRFHGAGYEMAR